MKGEKNTLSKQIQEVVDRLKEKQRIEDHLK
jgi:hypothetical protein